jgi:hypothetical protein
VTRAELLEIITGLLIASAVIGLMAMAMWVAG